MNIQVITTPDSERYKKAAQAYMKQQAITQYLKMKQAK